MGSPYTIEPQQGRACIRGAAPDLAAATRALQQLARDPAFKPEYTVLVDLGDVEVVPSRLDVEGLALCLVGLRERYQGRVALLSPRTALFGSVRRAALFAAAHRFPLDAFRTLKRAEAWLAGVDRDSAAVGEPEDG